MTNNERINLDYSQKHLLYTDFCKEVVNQLNFLIDENEIHLGFSIEYRVKKIESILEKIERNNLELDRVESLSDFARIRIICLFYKDVARVEKILEENFVILKKEDTVNRLSDNVFGYGSIHFEICPKEEWLKIPTFKKHASCKAELQLRTAAQHIWAAVSHILQYKKEIDIPLELRRSINRAAALLETVDLEFERVQIEREKYIAAITLGNKIDDELNIENLKLILDRILPPESKQLNEPYSELLDTIKYFDITTTDKLESVLVKHLKELKLESDSWIEESRKTDPKFNNTGYYQSGYVRLSLRKEFGKIAENYFRKKYSGEE